MLEARNAGKPIGDARGEMGMVADTFRYYAGAPERLLGDTIPVAGGIGVDGPRAARRRRADHAVELPADDRRRGSWRPALAAGNTVVLKPAELTPLTALRFARAGARGRAPRGRRQRRRRPGPRVRRAARRAPRRGQDRVHRLDRGRALDRRGRGGDDQARDARAGRQVGERRLRRRRPRAGGRDGAAGASSATPARTAARARASSSSAARSTASWTRSRTPSRR